MPPKKEKLPDGTTRVQFITKEGKHVVINRKPKEKRTRAPTKKPTAANAAAGGHEEESGATEADRPTNLLPVLVLDGYCSDDGEPEREQQQQKNNAVAQQQKPKRP